MVLNAVCMFDLALVELASALSIKPVTSCILVTMSLSLGSIALTSAPKSVSKFPELLNVSFWPLTGENTFSTRAQNPPIISAPMPILDSICSRRSITPEGFDCTCDRNPVELSPLRAINSSVSADDILLRAILLFMLG